MLSGGTPMDIFTRPTAYGGQRLGQPIDQAVIADLQVTLSESHKEAFRRVDNEFAAIANEAYRAIGSPALSLETGWQAFSHSSVLLQQM